MEIEQNRRRGRRRITLEDPSEFWKRIQKPVGCWLYDGAKEVNGYGYLNNPLGDTPKYITAHRLAWILTFGPVPEGLVVMHKCDVRSCVNPDHLKLGTDAENTEDKISKQRFVARLKPEEVVEVKRMLAAGEYQNAIAKKFGVDESTIHAIKKGRTWKHVPYRSP